MARWDSLFDDLESQLEHELDAERADVLAEEERLRMGRLGLRDRLSAILVSAEPELILTLRGGAPLTVRATAIGRDWIAGQVVDETRRRSSCVVPLSSIATVAPRGDQLAVSRGVAATVEPTPGPATALSARLGLPFVLRDLCRRRVGVAVTTSWTVLHGTIDRVGRDHLDLAEHDAGTARRDSAVRRTILVPVEELLTLRY